MSLIKLRSGGSLQEIGWPAEASEFDPPADFPNWEICQLVAGTIDGFPTFDESFLCESDPDPPNCENCIDPPHWEDQNYITYD